MNSDIRWKQRFQNFDRALVLLREALERGPGVLSNLEKKNNKKKTQVLKDAYVARSWLTARGGSTCSNHRNLLSHTYDFAVFEKAVDAIAARYLPALEDLHEFLVVEALK